MLPNKNRAFTKLEMREVDRVAVEEFSLQIMQMMELAAYQMAFLLRKELDGLKSKKILVVAGKGNNGGDAIASARHLKNWGAKPYIVFPKGINKLSQHHLNLARRIKISNSPKFPKTITWHAIIDGILGYSIKGEVREPYKKWITIINKINCPVFSYDLPSGLDPDDGSVHGSAVKATHTLTLAYPKKGLFVENAKKYVGKLFLADIGIPEAVYKQVKSKLPSITYQNPFIKSPIILL